MPWHAAKTAFEQLFTAISALLRVDLADIAVLSVSKLDGFVAVFAR